MRSGKVIITGVLVLTATAAILLRSAPLQVADREIPGAGSPGAVIDSLAGRDSAIGKSSVSGAAGSLDGARESGATARDPGAESLAPGSDADPKAYLQAPPLSKEEVKSVRTLVGTFFKYQRGKESLNKLIRELRMNGLEPVMARDFNPYTGKMLTIRTNEALTGTRYFHAQYFEDSDQNKEPFRQHLSFEVRGTRDAMAVTRKIIEENLGKKLGTPVGVRGDDWVEWKKDGDSIWIQRMGPEDLKNDPLNARTAADIGTLKVAIEQIPDEHHDEHPGAGSVH
jgi:hypothetical protein